MTRYGTSHFVNQKAAYDYYANQGIHYKEVNRKLGEREIHIGPPVLKPGETCRVIAREGRYEIIEPEMIKALPANMCRKCKMIDRPMSYGVCTECESSMR